MYRRTAPWARRIWIAIHFRQPPPLALRTMSRCCLKKAPSQGEVVLGASRGNLPDPGCKGSKTPTGSEFGPQPNTAPEPSVVPDSGRRSPIKRGKPPVLVASVHPEASDNLLEALRGASIDEEHRTIMSVVIKRVQSVKSGLTEACASLLTGFEVSI